MRIAYIGLGANIPGPAGTPEATLAVTVDRLAQIGRLVACSSLYSTEPVGLVDQPRFLNAVIAIETELAPRELIESLLNLEIEFGRDRSDGVRNGPRTLDLDILLYGDFVLGEHNLVVPHPRLAERAFVLVPLREIAPELRDPRTGATVSQLLEKLFPESEGDAHAVVQVESDVWRAGADDSGGAAGADSGADPHHG
jgi:2-amino-4-hydroxy-6-hydroxymethyldihydropteridine diphosphokinase